MFTVTVQFKTDKHTEYFEVGETFAIYDASDEDNVKEYKEKFPDAISFLVGKNVVIPILKECVYEIINSRGVVIKTMY